MSNKKYIWENMENNTEKRFYDITVEQREVAETEDVTTTIVGHAAVFDKLSENLGGFQERINKNAFDDVLDNDVRAFFNHDPNHLLARSTSGTLRLSTDNEGLKYEFDVPDTTTGRDLLVSMKRGDITQSSFAFTVEDDSWEVENGMDVRTINKVKRLYDVSPVSIPAYPDANDLVVAQRGLAVHKEHEQKKDVETDLISRNLLELKLKIINKKKRNEK
jgi:HK97 family phage prohead protease